MFPTCSIENIRFSGQIDRFSRIVIASWILAKECSSDSIDVSSVYHQTTRQPADLGRRKRRSNKSVPKLLSQKTVPYLDFQLNWDSSAQHHNTPKAMLRSAVLLVVPHGRPWPFQTHHSALLSFAWDSHKGNNHRSLKIDFDLGPHLQTPPPPMSSFLPTPYGPHFCTRTSPLLSCHVFFLLIKLSPTDVCSAFVFFVFFLSLHRHPPALCLVSDGSWEQARAQ